MSSILSTWTTLVVLLGLARVGWAARPEFVAAHRAMGSNPSSLLQTLDGRFELVYIEDHTLSLFDADDASQLGVNPHRKRFKFQAFERDYDLVLDRNTELLGPDYHVLTTDDDGTNHVHRPFADPKDHCFYRGRVRGRSDSSVSASTCDGLHGLIRIAGQADFYVEPAPRHLDMLSQEEYSLGSTHMVYLVEDSAPRGKKMACGVSHHEEHAAAGADAHDDLGVSAALFGLFDSKLGSHLHTDQGDRVANGQRARKPEKNAYRNLAMGGVGQVALDSSTSASSSSPSSSSSSSFSSPRSLSDFFTKGNAGLLAVEEKKYVELFIVNDFKRYSSFVTLSSGNENLASERMLASSLTIANHVTELYRNARTLFGRTIQVVAIAQHVFKTQIAQDSKMTAPGAFPNNPAEVLVGELLDNFHAWRSTDQSLPAHDNSQLFSGYNFQEGNVGYAGVSTMCQWAATGGIDQMTFSDGYNAGIVAHEMGHNFGMRHDGSSGPYGNTCSEDGYIMAAVGYSNRPPPETFSTCSATYINAFFTTKAVTAQCLDNQPSNAISKVCGNGLVEDGEQCDCGSTDCFNIDECCDGSVCLLDVEKQCSNDDPCCEGCLLVPASANRVCRARNVDNDCDLAAETCSGLTSLCPADRFGVEGASCTHNSKAGVCYSGSCTTYDEQCKEVGSRYQGGPFREGTNSHLTDCETLTCKSANGAVVQFSGFDSQDQQNQNGLVSVGDGVPCNASGIQGQCFLGDCEESHSVATVRWFSTRWQTCSESCGGGSQFRNVTCTFQDGSTSAVINGRTLRARGDCTAIELQRGPDFVCCAGGDFKPAETRECNQFSCDACQRANLCGSHGNCLRIGNSDGECLCFGGWGGRYCREKPHLSITDGPGVNVTLTYIFPYFDLNQAWPVRFNVSGEIPKVAVILLPDGSELGYELADTSTAEGEIGLVIQDAQAQLAVGRYRLRLYFAADRTVSTESIIPYAETPTFRIECSESQCQHGRCSLENIYCDCDPGFSGPFCSKSACTLPEEIVPEFGVLPVRAKCAHPTDPTACQSSLSNECGTCQAGWKGDQCDTPSSCDSPCVNGGEILNATCGRCTCPGDWVEASQCASCGRACKNGGTADAACLSCACPETKKGDFCEYNFVLITVRLKNTKRADYVDSELEAALPKTVETEETTDVPAAIMKPLWKTAFRRDIARGISAWDERTIEVVSVRPISRKIHDVTFAVLGVQEPALLMVTANTSITEAMNTPGSAIYAGQITRNLDPTFLEVGQGPDGDWWLDFLFIGAGSLGMLIVVAIIYRCWCGQNDAVNHKRQRELEVKRRKRYKKAKEVRERKRAKDKGISVEQARRQMHEEKVGEDALPQHWECYYNQEGIPYYYNRETGVTTWVRPRV